MFSIYLCPEALIEHFIKPLAGSHFCWKKYKGYPTNPANGGQGDGGHLCVGHQVLNAMFHGGKILGGEQNINWAPFPSKHAMQTL